MAFLPWCCVKFHLFHLGLTSKCEGNKSQILQRNSLVETKSLLYRGLERFRDALTSTYNTCTIQEYHEYLYIIYIVFPMITVQVTWQKKVPNPSILANVSGILTQRQPGGGGFNKPWPPGLGGKQTSPWRSESWIHGVGRAFMSFHSQSAFMSFHIFISFVLYHTTQSVSHFWIKQMVFRNSTQKKKHNHHRSTKRSTSFEKQCRTWVLELGGRGLWGWNLWRKTNQSFQETYGWQEAIGSQIESEGDE